MISRHTILISLFSLFTLHAHATWREDYKLLEKRNNHIIDSLSKTGVDTFLVYIKECRDCLRTARTIIEGDSANVKTRIVEIKDTVTSYLFWKIKGKYYVMKITPYTYYKPIERLKRDEYFIYDYWSRNRENILLKQHISSTSDILIKDVSDGHYIYTGEHFDPTSEADISTIRIILPRDTQVLVLYEMYETPLTPGKDSLGIGNTEYTYYFNALLPCFEWKRIIESELFVIEYKDLWIREKK